MLTNAKTRLCAILIAALAALAIGAVSAGASSSGGVDSGGDTSESSTDRGSGDAPNARVNDRYNRIWKGEVRRREKRWAERTSECESGGDPDAIGGGGKYRGAFQFLRSTWRHSPKTPGGDPIDYSWRTQAVVAVALKKRDGRGHWPVCG